MIKFKDIEFEESNFHKITTERTSYIKFEMVLWLRDGQEFNIDPETFKYIQTQLSKEVVYKMGSFMIEHKVISVNKEEKTMRTVESEEVPIDSIGGEWFSTKKLAIAEAIHQIKTKNIRITTEHNNAIAKNLSIIEDLENYSK